MRPSLRMPELRSAGTASDGGVVPFFLAVLSGVLLFFSFPKFGSGWVAWTALVPLLVAVKGKAPKRAFILGLCAGLVCHVGVMYWIVFVVVNYGYMPIYMGVGAMLIVAAYLSLYTGVFGMGLSWLTKKRVSLLLAAPALWVVLEYVKSHILTGFPWENLGYSQHAFLPLIQMSDITGVYGVSFMIVGINALLVWIAGPPFVKKRALAGVIAGVVAIVLVVSYGFWRMADIDRRLGALPELPVTLVQGNVDQSVKWDPLFQHQTMASYEQLTLAASPGGRRLIVWPETAVPLFFQDRDGFHEAIVRLARKTDSWLLFGSPSYKQDPGRVTLFNSAYLLSPDGNGIARYDKVHLVPYGEYVPLRTIFPFISKLVQGVGDFGTGPGYEPLVLDGHKVGVLICYEGIFPEAGRSYKRNGADLLVNVTNDAWFGRTSAPFQHLSMTVFRAVESRVYLVRAANTGITAFIDPTGRIVSRTGLFQTASLQGSVRFLHAGTIYGAWGDWLASACALILAVAIVTAMNRRKDND